MSRDAALSGYGSGSTERRITTDPVPDSKEQRIARAYQELASGFQTFAHVRREVEKHNGALLAAENKITAANKVLEEAGLTATPLPERPTL